MDQSKVQNSVQEEQTQSVKVDKVELNRIVNEIVEQIKTRPGCTLKQVKDELMKDYQNHESYKSKISEALKNHKFLTFKQHQKEIQFTYSETAEQSRNLEVQRIAKKLLDQIEVDKVVRQDKFLEDKDVQKWYFSHTLKTLKRQRKIQTSKDGSLTLIFKYLDEKDDQILGHLRNALLTKDIQLVTALKKGTVTKFPFCQSKNLTRILKLLTDEKCEDGTTPRVVRSKIGLSEYIYNSQHQERFDELKALFEQDLKDFETQMTTKNEEGVSGTVLQTQIRISDTDTNSVGQMIKYLNSKECGKIYSAKLQGKDKEKHITRVTSEKDEQVKKILGFLKGIVRTGGDDAPVFLTNKLREQGKLLQFLKIIEKIEFPVEQKAVTVSAPKKTTVKVTK